MIWSWKLPGPLEPRSWCHGFPRALWQTKKSPGKPQSFLTNTIPNAWFPMAIGQFIGKKKLSRTSRSTICKPADRRSPPHPLFSRPHLLLLKKGYYRSLLAEWILFESKSAEFFHATKIYQEMSETFTFGFTMHHRLGASNKKTDLPVLNIPSQCLVVVSLCGLLPAQFLIFCAWFDKYRIRLQENDP